MKARIDPNVSPPAFLPAAIAATQVPLHASIGITEKQQGRVQAYRLGRRCAHSPVPRAWCLGRRWCSSCRPAVEALATWTSTCIFQTLCGEKTNSKCVLELVQGCGCSVPQSSGRGWLRPPGGHSCPAANRVVEVAGELTCLHCYLGKLNAHWFSSAFCG